jgi:hypothetical protein
MNTIAQNCLWQLRSRLLGVGGSRKGAEPAGWFTETFHLTLAAQEGRGRYRRCDGGDRMPTILRSGPYRIYFYSHEPNEPPHVHVDRDKASCKVWLVPVALSSSLAFSARELREIERLVSLNRAILLKAWEEFHG